jgi:hypothetical protein
VSTGKGRNHGPPSREKLVVFVIFLVVVLVFPFHTGPGHSFICRIHNIIVVRVYEIRHDLCGFLGPDAGCRVDGGKEQIFVGLL